MNKITSGKPFRLFLLCILVFTLLFSGVAHAETSTSTDTAAGNNAEQKQLEYLQSIMNTIKEKYGGEVTDTQLVDGAIKGMFGSMDPYTVFFTPEEYESFMGSIGGTYAGIGISMEISGQYILVVKVFSGSPAEKVGILQGDRIVEADGKSLAGKSTEEAAALIKGEAGTRVKLGILREGRSGVMSLTVTRETIRINPVTYEIRSGIGYIKLDMFNANAEENMRKALDEMDRKKVSRIVLDLRNNPGGDVEQAAAVARMFVPRGLITRLDFKYPGYLGTNYMSFLDAPKYKLAVLVNGMSASASEIVAGAVQDTAAGKLVGTKTFGKAKVQSLLPILSQVAFEKYQKQLGVKVTDAYELVTKYGIAYEDSEVIGYTKITTGFYYTPKGRMIDLKGILPDYSVSDPKPVAGIKITDVEKLTGSVKLSLNSQGTDVLNAERIFKLLGYDVDQPDVKLDAKTVKAVAKFQKSKKLKADGVLGASTVKALNAELDRLVLKLDAQYAKAVETLK